MKIFCLASAKPDDISVNRRGGRTAQRQRRIMPSSGERIPSIKMLDKFPPTPARRKSGNLGSPLLRGSARVQRGTLFYFDLSLFFLCVVGIVPLPPGGILPCIRAPTGSARGHGGSGCEGNLVQDPSTSAGKGRRGVLVDAYSFCGPTRELRGKLNEFCFIHGGGPLMLEKLVKWRKASTSGLGRE